MAYQCFKNKEVFTLAWNNQKKLEEFYRYLYNNAFVLGIIREKILLVDENFDLEDWKKEYTDGSYWLLHTSKLGVGFDFNTPKD